LEKLMKGRTVITIAHRLSTIRNSDKIIVLTAGVVAEQGTHDELINLQGVYAELYRVQFEAQAKSTA
jgi:ABC-type multidrug transport system fused ATPase/permease subunit